MHPFEYVEPKSLKEAVAALGKDAKPLAGGIDLLDELKSHLIEPKRVVNLKSIPGLREIELSNKGLILGALVTLAEIESQPQLQKGYRALVQAAHAVGSPQIRNVGTLGGNLCQRPRCWYYREEHTLCLKKGGGRCYAWDGENQYHAILGGGPCYIVHPSDCAPALIAFGASVTIFSSSGERELPLEEFFVLPSQNLYQETILKPDEIVIRVQVPRPAPGTCSAYVKIRERDSFDWALASAAVVLRMRNGVCQSARVVLGGVAPIPWRSKEAEAVLKGKPIDDQTALAAGTAAVQEAKPLAKNAYKVTLAKNAVRMALLEAVA